MSAPKLDLLLTYLCKENRLTLVREFRFDKSRRWRADFYIELGDKRILIEYEGLVSSGRGGHQTKTGYTNNCEKYNRAAILGYIVLRYTAINFRTVENDLNELIALKQ